MTVSLIPQYTFQLAAEVTMILFLTAAGTPQLTVVMVMIQFTILQAL